MIRPLVLKFGGSSLSDSAKFLYIAKKIVSIKNKYSRPVVCVLSAPADLTDNLLNLAKTFSPLPREEDALAQAGEQISASLMAMALNKISAPAVSYNAYQLPIYAQGEYKNAQIKKINVKKINEAFSKGQIPIITGFQGILKNSDIVTLGRGGSDLSAAVLARFLKAEKCFLFSDVKGVYSANPSLVSSAILLKKISYEELIALAQEGCEVRQLKAVKYAQKHSLKLHFASSWQEGEGTLISKEGYDKGISCFNLYREKGHAKISIIGLNLEKNNTLFKKISILAGKDKKLIKEKNKILIRCGNEDAVNLLRKLHDFFMISGY
ncbi:MAG: aspartate kinase [Elusimicrobiota bacterium]